VVVPAWLVPCRYLWTCIQVSLEPRERIAVCSYSFREFIAGTESKSAIEAGVEGFAAHVIQNFNVNKSSLGAPFSSTAPKYLESFAIQ